MVIGTESFKATHLNRTTMLPTVTGAKAELSQHNAAAPHMAALQHADDGGGDGGGGRDDGSSGVAEGYTWLGAVLECCCCCMLSQG